MHNIFQCIVTASDNENGRVFWTCVDISVSVVRVHISDREGPQFTTIFQFFSSLKVEQCIFVLEVEMWQWQDELFYQLRFFSSSPFIASSTVFHKQNKNSRLFSFSILFPMKVVIALIGEESGIFNIFQIKTVLARYRRMHICADIYSYFQYFTLNVLRYYQNMVGGVCWNIWSAWILSSNNVPVARECIHLHNMWHTFEKKTVQGN